MSMELNGSKRVEELMRIIEEKFNLKNQYEIVRPNLGVFGDNRTFNQITKKDLKLLISSAKDSVMKQEEESIRNKMEMKLKKEIETFKNKFERI